LALHAGVWFASELLRADTARIALSQALPAWVSTVAFSLVCLLGAEVVRAAAGERVPRFWMPFWSTLLGAVALAWAVALFAPGSDPRPVSLNQLMSMVLVLWATGRWASALKLGQRAEVAASRLSS
jgi:hypothetical protein